MHGVFSSSPRSLAEAISPISELCTRYEWAICLQSGPFREHHFTEPGDPRNLLHLFYEFPEDCPPAWFRRGILPQHADDLIFDEWSYYLGFDADSNSAENLFRALRNDISPRKALFDILKCGNYLYIVFVDDGWWEGYATDSAVTKTLMANWQGKPVDSGRWDGPHEQYHPYPTHAT